MRCTCSNAASISCAVWYRSSRSGSIARNTTFTSPLGSPGRTFAGEVKMPLATRAITSASVGAWNGKVSVSR